MVLLQRFYYNPFTPFGPVPEKFGDEPFIDRTPIEIISSGDVQDVPWITGVTKEEGLYPVAGKKYTMMKIKKCSNNFDLKYRILQNLSPYQKL